MKAYKVLMIKEGAMGAFFFGASGIAIRRLEKILNEEAKDGWEVVFQVIEKRRMFLFWERETLILTLSKNV